MNIVLSNPKENPSASRTTWSEWGFVWAVILAVLLLSSIPYAFAYATTPPDKQFMGIGVNVPDHGQYFAWLREFRQADLVVNKQTPETNPDENPPVFFNLLWWGFARLANLVGVDGYATMYQLLRVVGPTLFLLLVYRVSAWFFETVIWRRTAFLITTFMSGFGWLLILYRELFMDGDYPLQILNLIFISEGITFFCAIGFPHFLGAALYILAFDLMLRGQVKENLGYAVAAGLVTLFFGLQHNYDLALVYGVLGSYGFAVWFRDRKPPWYLIKSGVIIFLLSVWPGIYSVWLTSAHPLWGEVLAQFDNAGVFTPNPLYLIVLLGPAFLLALFTALADKPWQLQQMSDNRLFLTVWLWVNFALLYIPTDFQIHMLNGWQIPLGIWATIGLFRYIIPFVSRLLESKLPNPVTAQYAIVTLMILIIIPTNLYLLLWRVIDLRRYDYPYYLHQDEIAALEWLEDNVEPDDVVLSSLEVGRYIPAIAGSHAFLSHWAQTIRFFDKKEMVQDFFKAETDDSRRKEILTDCNQDYDCQVDYVLHGPAEKALGSYDPEQSEFLEAVYEGGSNSLYKVHTLKVKP